jgi:isopentenyl diphosphate isomerase/L-lactate dehydrogenase-like FMN-dependent dehydrogenase
MRNIESKILTVEDAEHYARKRLPKSLIQQIEGGSGTGSTIRANLAAFESVTFRPRAAVSYDSRELSTTVLGHEISMPVLTAPTGNIRLYNREGEPGVARAAGGAGTIACISAFMGYPIEEVVAASSGPVFFQMYYVGGRANIETMIARARNAGAAALILTVDSAAWAQRERNVRQRVQRPVTPSLRSLVRFAPQVTTKPWWLRDFLRDGMRMQTPMALKADGEPMLMWEASATIMRDTPVWDDIAWIRDLWRGPVIVKGILRAEDARRAVAEGASAVIVSNHGGNSLDGAPAALKVLPDVVKAVGDEVEVLCDGGIRRGSDVVKALALGARAVLIGRGYLWAHAAAGGTGVSRVLECFRQSIDTTMALVGCRSVRELDASYVELPRDWSGVDADAGSIV